MTTPETMTAANKLATKTLKARIAAGADKRTGLWGPKSEAAPQTISRPGARAKGSSTTPASRELITLAHLRLNPMQRLVHQHPGPTDTTGCSLQREAAFWRRLDLSGHVTVPLTTFRALLAGGWIVMTSATTSELGGQVEFYASVAAHREFNCDPRWKAALAALEAEYPRQSTEVAHG